MRSIAEAASLSQEQYAGRSFHVGAATIAAQAGIEDSTTQTLGRWKIAVFLQYVRTPQECLAAISTVLASAIPNPGRTH